MTGIAIAFVISTAFAFICGLNIGRIGERNRQAQIRQRYTDQTTHIS